MSPTPGPRRLLLVSNRLMHYRVSVYNYFWRRFLDDGWDFSVVTNDVQEQNPNPVCFDLTVLPFGFSRYRRHVRDARPDAVVLFLHLRDRFMWPLLHWLKLAGIPVAYWTSTPADPRGLRKMGHDYLLRMSDALILYGAGLLNAVPEAARHKSFIANNTINSEAFAEIRESKEEIKDALGFSFEKIVLFVGRIGEENNRKRVDHLIEMFREVKRDDVGLVIVGSGLPTELEARMNRKNTMYMGEVYSPPEIGRIYKIADVASIPQCPGLGLNEAFFRGLPLVTEDGPRSPELNYLEHGRNGFMVPEGDVGALRDRILYLVDDDVVRARFSANARYDIQKRASIEGMFQGFRRCAEFLCTQAD